MPSVDSNSRISVITADNPGYQNPGMITVDLAFESIRKRLGLDVGVDWFTLHFPSVSQLRPYVDPNRLPFQFIRLEDLAAWPEGRPLVVWGDFLQTRHYIEQDAMIKMLRFGRANDREEGRRILHRLLLLGDEPAELLQRTILYGGTILHNSQADYLDSRYGRAFERLIEGCHSVWLRDPISVAKAGHVRAMERPARFGADAALLLDSADTADLECSGWADDIKSGAVAGVFVGLRTQTPSWLPSFCEALGARLKTRLEWLPWLEIDRRTAVRIEQRPGPVSFGDLLSALSRYRFVITDTYHLCVNAWRVGTPAICIGSPQPGFSPEGLLTLNDWKKHIFYASYEATDFYLSTETSAGELKDQAERIAHLIEVGGFEPVVARMHRHAEQSRVELECTMNTLIDHPATGSHDDSPDPDPRNSR